MLSQFCVMNAFFVCYGKWPKTKSKQANHFWTISIQLQYELCCAILLSMAKLDHHLTMPTCKYARPETLSGCMHKKPNYNKNVDIAKYFFSAQAYRQTKVNASEMFFFKSDRVRQFLVYKINIRLIFSYFSRSSNSHVRQQQQRHWSVSAEYWSADCRTQ